MTFERVPTFPSPLVFPFDLSTLSPEHQEILNRVGRMLQQQPDLGVDLVSQAEALENPILNENRLKAIQTKLFKTWQLDQRRINSRIGPGLERGERPKVVLKITLQP